MLILSSLALVLWINSLALVVDGPLYGAPAAALRQTHSRWPEIALYSVCGSSALTQIPQVPVHMTIPLSRILPGLCSKHQSTHG